MESLCEFCLQVSCKLVGTFESDTRGDRDDAIARASAVHSGRIWWSLVILRMNFCIIVKTPIELFLLFFMKWIKWWAPLFTLHASHVTVPKRNYMAKLQVTELLLDTFCKQFSQESVSVSSQPNQLCPNKLWIIVMQMQSYSKWVMVYLFKWLVYSIYMFVWFCEWVYSMWVSCLRVSPSFNSLFFMNIF